LGEPEIEKSAWELRRQPRRFMERCLSLDRLVVVHCFRTCPHRPFYCCIRVVGRSLRARDINHSETGHHYEAAPYGHGAAADSSHKSLTDEPI
jgi:hypothetical protein